MLTDCGTEPSKGPFAWSLHHPLSRQMSTCAGWCCARPSSPGCSTDTLGHSRYIQDGIIIFLGGQARPDGGEDPGGEVHSPVVLILPFIHSMILRAPTTQQALGLVPGTQQ